ncbi:hypothetical protein Y032_0355g3329 [Ancylostoma ceylanicum]|uniref:Uncharacterized protein n=1 Tax=Ancylostoma ceylanicum TaxID=53326 RepID=A0A016RX18_9BILA|nr:hypothetical protein Y032_0355g3329 [Ancylostoma ceylanicum]
MLAKANITCEGVAYVKLAKTVNMCCSTQRRKNANFLWVSTSSFLLSSTMGFEPYRPSRMLDWYSALLSTRPYVSTRVVSFELVMYLIISTADPP